MAARGSRRRTRQKRQQRKKLAPGPRTASRHCPPPSEQVSTRNFRQSTDAARRATMRRAHSLSSYYCALLDADVWRSCLRHNCQPRTGPAPPAKTSQLSTYGRFDPGGINGLGGLDDAKNSRLPDDNSIPLLKVRWTSVKLALTPIALPCSFCRRISHHHAFVDLAEFTKVIAQAF